MREREFEKILKALANKRRLAIVKYLKEKNEASVGEIADAINLSLRATSKHLSILFAVDIVERDQKSLQMFYYLVRRQKPVARSVIKLV